MRKYLVLAALAGALVLALPSVATAAPAPLQVGGNPSCDGGLKIDPVRDGTFTDGTLVVTIDVDGSQFSFTSNIPVFQVIVKGGPNGANVYNYALPGVTSDSGLASPLNNRGGPSGLSHACFFADGEKPPPPK